MFFKKEKPAVGANGQYTKNGSDTTSVASENQGDDSAVYAALKLQEIAGKQDRPVEPFIPIRDFSKVDHQVDANPKLVVVTMKAFLTTQLPPRQLMLDPWLTTQSLNMIYAWRGIGKTHVALGIAYAVASGGEFLGWKADQPRGILYLDGEMPGNALQERLTLLAKQNGKDFPEENFRLITPDLQKGAMPDLATPEGQQLIDSFILPSTDLIIVDNLSCLLRGEGRENEAESWISCGQWALSKRAQGKTVIFIHHAGKNGNQRGTSKREDILDTVVVLKRPSDYEPGEGARFEVHFEKARHLHGQNVEPFVAKLTQDEGKNQVWEMLPLAESKKIKVIELHREGMSNKEIADELEIDRSTVYRILNRAEDEGDLSPMKGKRKKQQ